MPALGLTVKPISVPNNFWRTDGEYHIFWVGDFIILYNMNTEESGWYGKHLR